MSAVRNPDEIRRAVRERYAQAAAKSPCGCEPAKTESSCCGSTPAEQYSTGLGYTSEELASLPEGANLGLGCGSPLLFADARPGETVLDLGSGGGIDCFLAAARVGETGRVIGVDMTPEMIQRARENAARAGLGNVEFRLGEIEHLPVADGTVDVVLSNCVINLSPDKAAVLADAWRVLKPGGRLAVSDVVATGTIPAAVRDDLDLHCSCVAGAISRADYEASLTAAGFTDIRIEVEEESRDTVDGWSPGHDVGAYARSARITARKPARS